MKERIHRFLPILMLTLVLVVLLTACGHTHSFGEWTVKREASCTDEGKRVRTCECGERESESIEAEGHEDGEWIVDVPATCVEDGSKCLECAVCGDIIKTEEIPASGEHNFDGKITTEATCSNDGVMTFTCTECGESYTEPIACERYSATEIYEMVVNSVGEIVTYDRNGNEYALGTGFVYSSDGKIITNYHVIDNAYSAKITINGTEYPIERVVTYDKEIDIAVLSVSGSGLVPVVICEEQHKVGETVYAFGSSKGLTATFSDGIITYSNREVDGVYYTQHDAPISSGNSGGPLINEYGEVIGINTWTVRESQNLNFAINVAELQNLSNNVSLTMAEFYQKECNPFLRLKNYIIENGTYSSNGDWYSVQLGVSYSSDYSSEYTRMAYYYVNENVISLDFIINDGEEWTYFKIDEDLSGAYKWYYFDDEDYEMSGILYAETYDDNTLLGYSKNNISGTALRDAVRKLASTMVSVLCDNIDTDLAEIGVTAADLHFYNY